VFLTFIEISFEGFSIHLGRRRSRDLLEKEAGPKNKRGWVIMIRRLRSIYDPESEFNFASDLQSSRDAFNLIEPMNIFKWIHQAYINIKGF
jgi:hypothetical protein